MNNEDAAKAPENEPKILTWNEYSEYSYEEFFKAVNYGAALKAKDFVNCSREELLMYIILLTNSANTIPELLKIYNYHTELLDATIMQNEQLKMIIEKFNGD